MYRRLLMQFFNLTAVFLLTACLCACSLSNKTPEQSHEGKETASEQSIAEISKDIIALVPEKEMLPKNEIIDQSGEFIEADDKVSQPTSTLSLYQQFLAQQEKIKTHLSAQALEGYQQALAQMKNKHWQQAQQLFDKVLLIEPNLSSCYVNKALISYHLNAPEQALTLLETAQSMNAINPYLYNLKGIIYRETGDFEQAQLSYEQAIKIWPKYAQAHLNLAVLLELYRGKFSQAKQHYLEYLSLQPNDTRVQRWLAGLEIKLAAN